MFNLNDLVDLACENSSPVIQQDQLVFAVCTWSVSKSSPLFSELGLENS